VEDDDGVRTFVRGILRKAGYAIVDAPSGTAALASKTVSPCGHDLLITDVVMPGINGAELARRLQEECPALKVIYLSGYMEDEMLRHGIATGAATFLQKPFSSEALLRKVRDILHPAG
jgi:two-component system, cell cycle sensor histidine kinase and response regulator CckA